MAFTFSDTIAGYVKRYDRNADSFAIETSDGREFTVGLTDTTDAQLVRNLGEPYVDATGQMRDMLVPGRYLFAYGVFYPEGGDARLRRQADHVPGRPRPRLRLREARLVGQADPPDGRLLLPGPVRRRRAELARVPRRRRHDRQQGRRPPGDRHDLPADLRPRDRLPDDRRGPLPRGGRDRHRVPARAPAQRRHERGHHLLVPRHRGRRAEREEDPRLGVRRRLRGHPGLRADLRPGRARPRSTGSPATQRIKERHRRDDRRSSTASSTTPSTAATARTSTRSRSTARATRSAATGPARTGTRSATTCRPT